LGPRECSETPFHSAPVSTGASNAGSPARSFPFEETKAARLAAKDPRPSNEERYGTHQGYVCVVTNAANDAVKHRFLRASAATTLIAAAQASNVLTDITPTAEDQAIGGRACLLPRHDDNDRDDDHDRGDDDGGGGNDDGYGGGR
jgi:hypothetical protein